MSALLEQVTFELSKLPGVGRRTALRLALHILKRDKQDAISLSNSISNFRTKVKNCIYCNNISDDDSCLICQDSRRDSHIICVVEQVGDLLTIEMTHQYSGLYHILGGVISPMDGVAPSDLHIDLLEQSISRHDTQEVILALPTTIEGETTSFYLTKRLSKFGIKISAISRGIGFGDEIEYADAITITHALKNRQEV